MNVYVETNCVLEWVFEQQGADACEELLRLAEAGRIRLAVPFLALVEPVWTIDKNRRSHSELADRFGALVNSQLRRRRSLAAESGQVMAGIRALLARTKQDDEDRIGTLRGRILASACVLPADGALLRAADAIRSEYGMPGYFDAIMLAAVLQDLRGRPDEQSCFITRDEDDFADNESIVGKLRDLGCAIESTFEGGLARVRAALG